MKTKVNIISRMVTLTMALFLSTAAVMASGPMTDIYTAGTSQSAAGDYVVSGTDDVYFFQGYAIAFFSCT